MIKSYYKKCLLAVIAMLASVHGLAIDYWTVGKVQAVLSGGEETAQAGCVYVSAEAVEDATAIEGASSMMQTDPVMLSGSAGSSAINKVYYYYAKANEGYTFIGFASTATGSPSGSSLAESLTKTGDYYTYSAKAGAGWSSNTEQTAKVATRYAVFEKTGDSGEGNGEGEGDNDQDTATEAKVVSVTNQHDKNLVNASLTVNRGEDLESGDIVTHIYITFDHELKEITSMAAHRELASKVTIVNTTTDTKLEFNQYSCGVKGSDKHVLDMFLSTDSYINNEDYMGVYVVTLPAGVATTTNNLPTQAYTFTFTYGDDSGNNNTETANLDNFLGNWKQMVQNGEEVKDPATFSLEKIGDAYFMTNLYATNLQIPVSEANGKHYLANTENDTYSFASSDGKAVEVVFIDKDGKRQVYLDQFTLTSTAFSEPIVGGICYFEFTDESIPSALTAARELLKTQAIYDLLGHRKASPVKGINIVNGMKYMVR